MGVAHASEAHALLRAVPVFAELDAAELVEIASVLEEECYEPGETVFAEGDPDDRLLIVAEGRAELCLAGAIGNAPLATLQCEELVGEQSLLKPGTATRHARLVATTRLRLLAMSAAAFDSLLERHPQLRGSFERHSDELETERFIARVGPFMLLDAGARRRLAGRVVKHRFEAGQVLFREGERTDSCYLLRSGTVEVVVTGPEGPHIVARIGAGNVVGETAMLTDAPRAATVRAIEPCDALELCRPDLEAVFEGSRSTEREFRRLARSRQRPRRDPLVIVNERRTSEGETITTLKHPERLTYYRLSERGRCVWEHLDGLHDLRALTRLVLKEFGEFVPGPIATILCELERSGMVITQRLRPELADDTGTRSRTERLLRRARRTLEREWSLHHADQRLTTAYHAFGWIFFTRAALLGMATMIVAGLGAFVVGAGAAHDALAHQHKQMLLCIIPALLVSLVVHEAAHAFTVKAFGREVHRAGVGWYWFGPIAFVDTTDVWLDGPRERILVSCAGPLANLALGGMAAVAALTVSDDATAAALWLVAVPNYLSVVANLNPLLEFDGYHILSDALDRPNLRADALSWIGAELAAALRDRQRLQQHWVDLVYGLSSVAYIAFNAAVIVVAYRLTVEGALASAVPAWIATSIGWTLAGGLSLLALLALGGELRGVRKA